MSSGSVSTKRDHALLIADGGLMTAGTMTVAMALMFGAAAIFGEAKGGVVLELLSSLMLLAGGILGPVLAWLLYGRRLTVVTVLGGLVGVAIGGAALPLFAALSFLLGLPLKLVTPSEFAGPLAMLALVSVGVVAVIVWLLADGARDLAGARVHVRLDLARIASAVLFAVIAAVCVYLIFAAPGPEQGEAVIWVMAGSATGAGVVAGADLAEWLVERGKKSDAAAAPGA